MHKLVTGFC